MNKFDGWTWVSDFGLSTVQCSNPDCLSYNAALNISYAHNGYCAWVSCSDCDEQGTLVCGVD